ncbi:MAG: hypothetical protein ACF8R7_14600 [Phycisphaerales bacterium JB039]
MVWLLLGIGAAAVVGAALLTLGLRGKRLNDHPICRRCGFDLIGREDLRATWGQSPCTDCGADLKRKRAIRWGLRRRRPAAAAVGALLLIGAVGAGGALACGAIWGFDWNRVKPVWLLARQMQSADDQTAEAAIDELRERIEDERLAPDSNADVERARRLADTILSIQGDLDRQWRAGIGVVFEELWTGGFLTDALITRYVAQAYPLDIRVRDTVLCGDPLPVRFEVGHRSSSAGQVVLRAMVLDVIVNGQRIDGPRYSFVLRGGRPWVRSDATLEERSQLDLIPTSNGAVGPIRAWTPASVHEVAGRHDVTVRLLLQRKPVTDERHYGPLITYRHTTAPGGDSPPPADPDPLADRLFGSVGAVADVASAEVVEFSRRITVLETGETVRLVTGATGEAAAKAIAESMELDRRSGGRLWLELRLSRALSDMGAAYEVFMEREGEREQIGGFHYDPADPSTYAGNFAFLLPRAPETPAGERVRIMLLPSTEWARRSVSLERICGEEIEIELPVPE